MFSPIHLPAVNAAWFGEISSDNKGRIRLAKILHKLIGRMNHYYEFMITSVSLNVYRFVYVDPFIK